MKIPKGKILIGEGQLQAGDEFYYADGERFPVPNNVIGMDISEDDFVIRDGVQLYKSHYDYLRKRSRLLEGLESGGVDNWEWYGQSLNDAGYWTWLEEEGLDE